MTTRRTARTVAELLQANVETIRRLEVKALQPQSLTDRLASKVEAEHYSVVHALLAALPAREAVTTNYDTLFERSFYSYELGCMKPDVLYFQRILASLPVAPGQILFIDDLEPNVIAARSVGIQAAQFVHPRSPDAVMELRSLLETFSVTVPS